MHDYHRSTSRETRIRKENFFFFLFFCLLLLCSLSSAAERESERERSDTRSTKHSEQEYSRTARTLIEPLYIALSQPIRSSRDVSRRAAPARAVCDVRVKRAPRATRLVRKTMKGSQRLQPNQITSDTSETCLGWVGLR